MPPDMREGHYSDVPHPVVPVALDWPAGHDTEEHRHLRHQLAFAIVGVMKVTTEGGSWVVPPQRAVWIPARTAHRIHNAGALSLRTLYIDPNAAPGMPDSCRVVTVTPLLRELILEAMRLGTRYDEDGPGGRLMRVLLEQIRLSPQAPLHLPNPSDPRVRVVTDALRDRPADPRSLVQWARAAGASPRTLSRAFLKETGMSFGRWRQQLRLLEALDMLATGESVTNVALNLGYDSPSAFVAMFRRSLGVPPGRYFSSPSP